MSKTQRGFSLIGLLIGLVIAAVILAGITQAFYTYENAQNQVTTGSSALTELEQKIAGFIEKQVSLTGYREPAADGSLASLISTFPSGYVSGTDNTGPNNSDTLTFSFQGVGDGSSIDCAGNPVAAYAISNNTLAIDSNHNLICNAVAIASGVTNFQVLYGEDTDGDGYADRFAANTVANNVNMNHVVALRLGFLLQGGFATLNQSALQNFSLLGTPIQTNDNRLYQTYVSTISLRNVNE